MVAGPDTPANLADYGISGIVAVIFLGGVVYLFKRGEEKQLAHTEELVSSHAHERDGWLRERLGLEAQVQLERQRGESAYVSEQARGEALVRSAESRAADERHRAERLADELGRSIQGGQAAAMAAVVEAQRLLRLALGEPPS